MKRISKILLICQAVLLAAGTVFADVDVKVSVNPESHIISVTGENKNASSASITVFSPKFTVGSVQSGDIGKETFSKDLQSFSDAADSDKRGYVDYTAQKSTDGSGVTAEYTCHGTPGRYAAYISFDNGESGYKYFTYITKDDFDTVLAEMKNITQATEMLKFAECYKDVVFSSEVFDKLKDESKLEICGYMCGYTAKYTSLNQAGDDFEKNAVVQLFYDSADDGAAAKIVKDYMSKLSIGEEGDKYLAKNDTFKAKVCKSVRDGGSKDYYEWAAAFKSAVAAAISEDDKNSGNSGSGTSSSGGSRGAGASYSTGNTALQNETKDESKSLYADVAREHWAYESISVLTARGIVSGDGNGSFRPNDTVTRAEFLKMILSATGLVDNATKCSFADVSDSDWYYPYAASAQIAGIAAGDGENFRPNAPITRQDAAKIMYNAAMFRNLVLKENRPYKDFTDGEQISDYAVSAIKALYSQGVLNGYNDGSFMPGNGVTRAESAQMTFAFLKNCM